MSASLPATEKFIRFQLEEMSSRNEHHEFEEVAVRIARRRISTNILIASGPVSAGGDHQRDAESYYTRIPDELPHSAGFATAASTAPVVIACTTQKDRLKEKVLADLDGICSTNAAPVERIAYFSIHPIPAAQTHDLQAAARENYSVGLDIFSGDDLSTMLAEPDLCWVAVHHLDLPSSMVPEPDGEPSPAWYRELITNLRTTKGLADLTPGVQAAVTRGTRSATWDRTANSDLPEWLDFMGTFLADSDDGIDTEIVFRPCYEMAVARVRGMGTASDVEDLVRRALAYSLTVDTPTVLEDAATLVGYWGGAWAAGIAASDVTEISENIDKLHIHTAAILDRTDAATHPIRAASLTSTMARLYTIPDWAKVAELRGTPPPVDTDKIAGMQLDEYDLDTSTLATAEEIDLAQVMHYLRALVDILPNARPFPVSSIAKIFQFLAPALITQPEYKIVRDALDDATAAVEGESARAERCRDRALSLVRAGRYLDGLAELHEAKIGWFHGDTLYGALLILRYIAHLYADLGLMYAAKMYSCGAATMAVASSKAELKAQAAKALLEAMQYAQRTGCWIDAAALGRVAVLARHSLLADPFNYEKHPEFEDTEINAGMELAAIRKYWPDLEEPFVEALGKTGWDELISETADEAGKALRWSEEDFQGLASQQFSGPLLGDVGRTRIIDFRTLGVRWTFIFNNDRTTGLTAEGLCAALQVMLAEIASFEPVFANVSVRVGVEVVAGADETVNDCQIDYKGPDIVARVVLSDKVDDVNIRAHSIMTIVMMLLDAVHVRPPSELQALLEPMFVSGLLHKLSVGRPYEDAAGLLDEQHYDMCAAAERPATSASFEPVESASLAAATSPGTGYDGDWALQLIRERYEAVYETIPKTLTRLLADVRGRELITRLRDNGWLDWQILVTVANVVANWRVQQAGVSLIMSDPKQLREIAMQPEDDRSPEFPLELIFNVDWSRMLDLQVTTVAQRWEVQPATQQMVPGKVRDLLTRRYGYAVDDVRHVDPLDALDDDGQLIPFVSEQKE